MMIQPVHKQVIMGLFSLLQNRLQSVFHEQSIFWSVDGTENDPYNPWTENYILGHQYLKYKLLDVI